MKKLLTIAIIILTTSVLAYAQNLALKVDSLYVNKSRISFNIPFSSGSLTYTAADMLKWQNALNQNLLLGAYTA